MKRTKYLNKTFDNNWKCVHVGVAIKQPVFYKHTKIRSKRPHHQCYYYLFVRETSDGKFDKMIRLNFSQAARVYDGTHTVEYYANKKESITDPDILDKIGYYFK